MLNIPSASQERARIWTSQVALEVKNPLANAGHLRDGCWIPGSGISPAEGNGNLLQYSCLENSMDRGAWWTTVHRVTKSQIRLKRVACVHSPKRARKYLKAKCQAEKKEHILYDFFFLM